MHINVNGQRPWTRVFILFDLNLRNVFVVMCTIPCCRGIRHGRMHRY